MPYRPTPVSFVFSLALAALAAVLAASPALGQLGILSRVVTTSMDARTKAEVTADTEISAGASKRLLEDKQAQWSGVTLLVFAQHVVLAGAVKTADAKTLVEKVVKSDKRIRSLKNELQVGDVGGFAGDTALDTQINGTLTAAKGVSSVNMRWHATGGRVVLMGVAQSRQEANLAVQKIRGVSDVKAVVSHLRIVAKK